MDVRPNVRTQSPLAAPSATQTLFFFRRVGSSNYRMGILQGGEAGAIIGDTKEEAYFW